MGELIRLSVITIPDCCLECKHYWSELDETLGRIFYGCNLNIYFPTKKQSCKKQVIKEKKVEDIKK